jgi:ribosomal protein S6--L-glutamate ligase
MHVQDHRTVGIWMYQNGGGAEIERKIISKLLDRGIDSVSELDLGFCEANRRGIICKGRNICGLDLFFSYNAGEQTLAQVYFYEQINKYIPTINSFDAFRLTEDKLQTNMLLARRGISCVNFAFCHRSDTERICDFFDKWEKIVLKPVDGWGGVGMTLIDNEATLNALLPFLSQMDVHHYYIEKYIDNDHTDYRIDIVDGEYISCYGRQASEKDWRTNVTSGGHILLREPNDEIVNLAINATKAIDIDIAGVDVLYDREKEEYVVLEINGIPAFATPEQEKIGLNFNDKKIDAIVNLIDKKTQGKRNECKKEAS